MTLGQLDRLMDSLWPGHLQVHMEDSQAGRMVFSPSVTLGKTSVPHLCSQSLGRPALAVWGVSGHYGNCSSPEDQDSLRRETEASQSLLNLGVEDPSVCGSAFGLGDPAAWVCTVEGLGSLAMVMGSYLEFATWV